MLERDFQPKVIKEAKRRYSGCIVMKTDPNYIQGIPDLIILHNDKWAALECKKSKDASHRPNQDYWVDRMNRISFASFIYPENKKSVFKQLDAHFKSGG